MMMNFLDLSAASEEERRLIRELLSDTSVVNIAEPQTNQNNQQPKSQFVATASKNNPQHRLEGASTTTPNTNNSNNNFNPRQAHQQQYHAAKQTSSSSSLSYSGLKSQHSSTTNSTSEIINPKQQHQQLQPATQPNISSNNTSINSVVSGGGGGGGAGARLNNTLIDKVSQTSTRSTSTSQESYVKTAIDKFQPATPINHNNNRFPPQTTIPSNHQNGFETNLSEDIKPAVASQTSPTTNLISEASANVNNAQQQHSNNPQNHHTHMNGQRHTYKSSPNNNHMNYSATSSNAHNNNSNSMSSNVSSVPLAHRNNYSSQRKNIHNNSNNSSNNIINNSIGNNSGNSIRNTRVPSLNNVTSVLGSPQQQHYPQQQYTPPLPSNASSTHFHNMNINNINNHSANALNSQLNLHQRTSEHTNERLRTSLNSHMNSSSDVNNIAVNNIAVTSASNLAPLNPNLDQHHLNTLPLNIYNHHTAHLHHQVPSIMPTAKQDPKNSNLKSHAYHSQDTSNSMNNTTGNQSVPSTAQMTPLAGDMNSVISMDMTSTHPQSYAIPPHVTAFGPPPHHVYSGAPIFQPYYQLIPYNLPPYVPYVIPPNPVVSTRQQVPLQSNHSPHSNSPSSHSRHMNQQQQNHEQYNNTVMNSPNNQHSAKDAKDRIKDLESSAQSTDKCIGEKEESENVSSDSKIPPNHHVQAGKLLPQVKDKSRAIQESENLYEKDIESAGNASQYEPSLNEEKIKGYTQKPYNVTKNCSSTPNKNKNIVPITKSDKLESQLQKPEADTTLTNLTNNILNKTSVFDNNSATTKPQDGRASTTTSRTHNKDDMVELTPESSDTASSLDNSKQCRESVLPICDQSESSEIFNKSLLDGTTTVESTETKNAEGKLPSGGSASSKSWADLFKRRSSALLGSSINGEAELNNSGLENSDEDNRNSKSSSTMGEGSSKTNSHTVTTSEQRSHEAARRALDTMAPRMAQKISSINLKHALPFLKPRGFINKGNGCYINATLQALIACPPFYNLMKEIGDLRAFRRENSSSPILDSFAEFFLNFPPLDASKKNKQLTSPDQKMHINNLQAEAIEPRCIYNVLGLIKSECLKGAQEDAEEFLSSVLNGLHEEMIGLSEVTQESTSHNGHRSDVEDSNEDVTNDENLWREVGSRNRSLPIRTAKVINTPIQEIFGGSLFSIRTAGKDRCGHRSPFFDLQLDISGDNVKSVQDAIKSFTATEVIHDFYCSKTKQKLDAQRRTSLDQLPPILILHLKQFVYTQDHGLRKLVKKIDYPIDFELPENCLHEKNSSDKNLLTSRSYKLLAVVYHDGKEAIKGHYLTDVYHIGSNQWIRCDDSNLRVIPAPRIENPEASHRTPYLLFYRRLNTLRAQTSNYDNKKKN